MQKPTEGEPLKNSKRGRSVLAETQPISMLKNMFLIRGGGSWVVVRVSKCYFLWVRYSCMALAARLPAPMALMTVAAPVATSPPA